jgi:hypothetical protein
VVTRASDLAGWEIATQGRSPLLAHAGKELRQHLAHLAPTGAPGRIVLSHGTADHDSFTVGNAADQLTLHGAGPRGVLNAAYWLLEQAGFACVGPGSIGARLGPAGVLPEGTYRSSPAFARRTLILGQDALHDDWREWMEWASRNRLNDIFFHDTPPSVWDRGGAARPERHDEIERDGRGWMFELWDRDGAVIAAEAAKRGMTIQFGGHHLPALLPRELFAEHPDWFPLRAGKRDARFNVCVSAAGGIEQMRSAAAEFFERFAGADIYHLWADDIRGGGWCECDGCAAMSPSDQALRATNIVAEALAAAVPGARIAHLAYHDTLQPPTTITPHENVVCLFAPRERCYAHAIDDESCARNRDEYWRPYNGLLRTFGDDRGRVSIFEYHSDAILFKGMAPMHLEVLPRDAAAYAHSAHNLQNLVVGPRPWLGAPWHAWWMARCAWDPAVPVDDAVARFWAAVDPAHGEELRTYARQAETAYRRFLDLHDLQGARGRDVLDFSDTPRETMRLKAAEAVDAARELADAVEALPEPAGDAEAFNREALQGYFVALIAEHLSYRLAGWAAALDGDTDSARTRTASARTALARIKEFEELFFDGSVGGSPAYANLGPRMWRGMELLTEAVERLLAGAEKV